MNPMNRPLRTLLVAALSLLLAPLALAAAENFTDEASAKGLAEIRTAELALKESQSEDVRAFAQKMIDDHTRNRQQLAELAQQHDLELSDEATLMDRAKALILQLRQGENFDKAYANNQVAAHKQTIELYRQYLEEGDNEALKAYAKATLPTLEEHLRHAEALAKTYGER